MTIPLALITIAAFLPELDNGFVNWDDEINFLDNPHFRGLGLTQMKWAWTTFLLGVYQPLAWLLFEAEYVFWKLDSRGYHLTSVCFHTVNAIVLYISTVTLLVRCQPDSWFKSPWTCLLGAWFATALFAVHPLRVEPVAWASCQPYLPCALFSMLTILAYFHAFGRCNYPQSAWLGASFVMFMAALLSHAVAVSLPLLLLILDVYPLRRFGHQSGGRFGLSVWRAWGEKTPFILASLVFMGLAIAARREGVLSTNPPPVSECIAVACYGVWFYILKTVVPLNLVAVYPLPPAIDWIAPQFMLSILGTVLVTAGLFLLRSRYPGLMVAWLSYLVILAPNLGIIRTTNQIAADRYSYMAMLSWVTPIAIGVCWFGQTFALRSRFSTMKVITPGLAVLIGLILMTWNQCRTWRDSRTLWTHALSHGSGSSATVHASLGLYFDRRGNLTAAAAQYAAALRLEPTDVQVHNNLGAVLSRQGKFMEAEAQYTEALRLNPRFASAHYNLALLFVRLGKYAEAATHFLATLRLDPNAADAHYNLGMVLSRQGRYTDAAVQYKAALRLKPDLAGAYNNLGTDLARQGKLAEAQAHYMEALRLNPRRPDTHTNLGITLSRQGKFADAAAHYTEALRLDPDYHEARKNLELNRP